MLFFCSFCPGTVDVTFTGSVNVTFFLWYDKSGTLPKWEIFRVQYSSCATLPGICAGACEVLKGVGRTHTGIKSSVDKRGSLKRLLSMAYSREFLQSQKAQFWSNTMYSKKRNCKGHKNVAQCLLYYIA